MHLRQSKGRGVLVLRKEGEILSFFPMDIQVKNNSTYRVRKPESKSKL